MKKALNLFFWGYLLVFVRIEIAIDILPVPLGYFIIAMGCLHLVDYDQLAHKIRIFALVMSGLSIPTIFVDVHQQVELGWQTYSLFILMGQLVLVYLIFHLLKEIIVTYGSPLFLQGFTFIRNLYIGAHLLFLGLSTFTLNLGGDAWTLFIVSILFLLLLLDISFLILLRLVRQLVPPEV